MTDVTADPPPEPGRPSKKPLIIGLILAIVGAAGGYFAVSAGVLPFGKPAAHEPAAAYDQAHEKAPDALPDVAFVPLEPIVVSLVHDSTVQHLRFRAQLEVEAAYRGEVESVLPRVMDVLNSYLRALEVADLTDPMALGRLRAQMLRRIQIVTGKGRVRDLLIMDFVLN